MADPIFAHGGVDNAELIAKCANLLYIVEDDDVLDCTYGKGRFWTKYLPPKFTGCDLDPAKSPVGYPVDFTAMPFDDASFDVVVLDGPYQLNGTSTGKGPSAKDGDYGVTGYESVEGRHRLLADGMTECVRVLRPARKVWVDKGRWEPRGGILLFKCQTQVCSGAKQWQPRIFADHGETLGLVLEDEFLLPGYRAQPDRDRKHQRCDGDGCDECFAGRVPSRQAHAATNYSTLLVFRKPVAKPATLGGDETPALPGL